jgi:hypothetical protein
MYFHAWPFGVTPEKHSAIWADRQDLFDILNDLFQNFAERKRSYVQPLWGYLGAGKTHAIWHFSYLLEKEQRLTFIYSKFPTQVRNFLELYQDGFVPSFDFEVFIKNCSHLWNNLTQNKDEEEAFFWILDQIAHKSYDFAQVVYNLAKMWSISPMKALRDPLFGSSRMWLQGAKLGRRDMSAIGVTNNIQNDSDAALALGGIIRLLTSQQSSEKGGVISPIVWIMDDSHVLFARPSKEQELIQRGIRRTVDECPTNLLILMSFATPDPEKISGGMIDDLKTVSAHSIIEVPPLSREEASIFVKDLINHENFKRHDVTDEFYPYTKEGLRSAIKEIVNKGVDLLPRNIIKCFEHLTDEAQKAKIEHIDVQFVNLFFKQKCVSKFCPLTT